MSRWLRWGRSRTVSFELFGHFHNVISDLDDFFDHTMRSAAARLIL